MPFTTGVMLKVSWHTATSVIDCRRKRRASFPGHVTFARPIVAWQTSCGIQGAYLLEENLATKHYYIHYEIFVCMANPTPDVKP